jgi:hypothetical protein
MPMSDSRPRPATATNAWHVGSVLALLALAACGKLDRMMDPPPPTAPARIFSPNGEPLRGGPLGHPACRDALSRWFERVDTNHDGFVDRAEFRADAARQFKIMDLDHDGEITPDELARYRAPYEVDTVRGQSEESADHGEKIVRMIEQADPVMLADVQLRNRVNLAEFMAYADRNFADLDANHDGRLVKSEIEGVCGPGDEGH